VHYGTINVLICGVSNNSNAISVNKVFKSICYLILFKIPSSQSNNPGSNGAHEVLVLLHLSSHVIVACLQDLMEFSTRNRNVLHDSRSALWTW
jgi:hypothetical protein